MVAPATLLADGVVEAIDLGGLETRTAALMLSAQEAGDLGVSALAVPLPGSDTTSRVMVVVDAPGPDLLAGAPGNEIIVEIYAYAINANGGLAATLTRAFRLPLSDYRPSLESGGIKFLGHVDLPPGKYSLRTLVLHRATNRMGLRILSLEVPPWSQAGPILLPPLRHEPAARWISVVEAEAPAAVFPIRVSGESRLPSTRPLDGSPAELLLIGRGLAGLRASLLDSDREELQDLGLGDLRPVETASPELEMLATELTPPSMESGAYTVRVTANGDVSAGVPLHVRAERPEVVAEAPSRPPPTFPRLSRLSDAYYSALAAWKKQPRVASLQALIEAEDAQLGSGTVKDQRLLAEAELEIANQLARDDPEALVPLIGLHEQLYRSYHAQRRFLLATHSRKMVEAISGLYRDRNSTRAAAELVAGARASMASYLQMAGAALSAQELFESALEIAPEHPAALLGLATIRESYADHDSVVELLRRLLRIDPEAPQTRLRLAINLARTRNVKEANQLLRQVLEAPSADWIAALAAQELARSLTSKGNLDEARATLEAAVERQPDIQRLRLQLASVLDRAGRPAEARAAIERLDPLAGAEVASPRLRYSSVPRSVLQAARRKFNEQVARRLPLLDVAQPTSTAATIPAEKP